MNTGDAIELAREQATEYPEGPWSVVLAELDRLRVIEAALPGLLDEHYGDVGPWPLIEAVNDLFQRFPRGPVLD